MNAFTRFQILFISLGIMASCMKEVKLMPKENTNKGTKLDTNNLSSSPLFVWENSKTIKISIAASKVTNQNEVHVIAVYNKNPKQGGKLITTGTALWNKAFESTFSIANTYKTIFVQEIIPGFGTQNMELLISNSIINHQFNSNHLGKTSANIIPPQNDSDNDNVPDSVDNYPNDASKAYNNYYPLNNENATLAFEDLWPYLGDYDLNDVVMKYKYNVVTNASNKVVQVIANYTLMATGGSFQNGFGVEFPINKNQVTAITGATLENRQTKAVIILFNNMRNEMKNYNTVVGQTISDTVNYQVEFEVEEGPLLTNFGLNEYNPFIWNNTAGFGRGYEIHLPNKTPTNLANYLLFGTNSDNSNLTANRFYVSKSNEMPWALNIPANFDYPIERNKINTAYTKFNSWVLSSGAANKDWYTNQLEYRDNSKIFKKL